MERNSGPFHFQSFSFFVISFLNSTIVSINSIDGNDIEMPLTVQEELSREFTLQINQLTAVTDSLKMEKERSLQAFDKYRYVVKLMKMTWNWNFYNFLTTLSFSLLHSSPLLTSLLFSYLIYKSIFLRSQSRVHYFLSSHRHTFKFRFHFWNYQLYVQALTPSRSYLLNFWFLVRGVG